MFGTDPGTPSTRSPGVAVLAFLGLALVSDDVVIDGPLTRLEHHLLGPPPTDAGRWPIITQLGGRTALAAMTATATALAFAFHRNPWRPVLTVGAGTAVRWLLMRWIGRPRPPRTWWRTQPDGASFPSRHATSATLGLLAIRRQLPSWPGVAPGLMAIVVVECCSRIRLGVHWPTDVVGGVLLAACVDSVVGTCGDQARGISTRGER
jgi:undecaprenyl-diphosphatase